jgi:hypothetical protein
VLLQGPPPVALSDSQELQAELPTCVEFVASHSLNAVEEGLPTVNETIITADAPIPFFMNHYYFECKVVKEPVIGSISVGFRSLSLDVFANTLGQRWLHHRPASGLDRPHLKVGDYVEVLDTAQRPARWEPCRIIDTQSSKVKIGWLYWPAPEFQIWLDRKSTKLAAFLTHTRGPVPLMQDRRIAQAPAQLKNSQIGDMYVHHY